MKSSVTCWICEKITYVLWTYFFSFFCPVFRIESQSVAQARHKFTNPLPQPPECQDYRCVPPYSEKPCLVPFPLNFLFLSFLFLSFLYFLDFLISSFSVVLCTTPKFHTLVLYPWATSPAMSLCFFFYSKLICLKYLKRYLILIQVLKVVATYQLHVIHWTKSALFLLCDLYL